MKDRETKVLQKLEGFPERQAERDRKRRHHVVRPSSRFKDDLGDNLATASEPINRDLMFELAWMNRGSRI